MNNESEPVGSMQINTVGIVGLGLLGRGIATCFLSRGLRVVAVDRDPKVIAAAHEHISNSLKEMVDRNAADAALLSDWHDRYHASGQYDQFGDCDFVIESVSEQLEIKRSVFAQLEEIISPATPIGSNTSALPITLLQQECRNPERIVGMHWAEPCHLTRFLEVIRGEQTGDAAVELAISLGERAGKDPTVVKKDVAGFIVNRLGYAMYREAFWLLEQGVADVETIDRAFRNAISVWANIAGPFRWMDLTGLPAYAAVMERLFPQLSNATEVPEAMKQLVDSGAKGIANGHGFYQYTPEEAQAWESMWVENVWKVNEIVGELKP